MTELEKDNNDLRTQITALETGISKLRDTPNSAALKSALKPPKVAFDEGNSGVSLADTRKVTSVGGTIGTNLGTNPAATEA